MKLKILLAITRLSLGGAGKFIVQLAKGLKKNNFDVTVICGIEDKNCMLKKELHDHGIKLLFINTLKRDIDIVNDLKSLIAITKLLKNERFDIVHSHTTKAGVIVRLSAFINGYRAIIYNPHGHIYEKTANLPGIDSLFKRTIFFFIEKFVNFLTKSIIICVSEKEYKDILNMGYSQKKYTYLIPHGIVIEEEAVKEYKDNIKNILVIGRLSTEKGQDNAIETLKVLHTKNNYFRLTIVGDGIFKDKLIRITQEYKLEKYVSFLPSQDKLKEVFENAFCVLIPSRYEGFSITALEAFKFKRPVVITANCGISKHLKNGIEALITSIKPEDLAYAIMKLASDSSIYNRLVDNAYKKLLNKFSFETTLERYIAIYKEASHRTYN